MQRNPVFEAYRHGQRQFHDRRRPCLLIDHPEAFRRISGAASCQQARTFPPGYLDGPIARAIDEAAAQWQTTVADLEPLPMAEAPPEAGPVHVARQ